MITTSFSSKSEGSLHLSLDGHYLTYMGYNGAAGLEGVSNSYTTNPAAQPTGTAGPFYDRAVGLINYNGLVGVTLQNLAYSGDNPRGAISLDGKEFYMAGNAATRLPVDVTDDTDGNDGSWDGEKSQLDQFVTLKQSRSAEAFRGVAFAPTRPL